MSTSPEKEFLLLWKGKQSGPFPVNTIREKLNSGEISRMHQVKYQDRWVVLDEFLEKHAGGDPEGKRRAEAEQRECLIRQTYEAQLQAERAQQNILEVALRQSQAPRPLVSLSGEVRSPGQPITASPPRPPQFLPPAPPHFTPPMETAFPVNPLFAPPPPLLDECPPNYLTQAILATIFCFFPLGIVAIVYANQVETKHYAGDAQGALDASANARTWCQASVAVAVVGIIFGIFILLARR